MIAPVIGTVSATVIQSIPSMKLVRLTNQTPPRRRPARSIHHGSAGRTRESAGMKVSTRPTAAHCSARRRPTGSGRMSSMAPAVASTSAAIVSARNSLGGPGTVMPKSAAPSQAAANVAMITAAPPPCGVGSRCEERAFGRASAWALSQGESARIRATLSRLARTATAIMTACSRLAMTIIMSGASPQPASRRDSAFLILHSARMDHAALELLNVAQEAILVLDAVGRFAVLPFPFVPGEGLDLGDQVAHLAVVEHAPELPVELTSLAHGDAVETAGA